MADSLSLLTAQISFLNPRLALIHVPLHFYSFFLQPILRLLFGEDHDEDAAKIPWTNRHEFLNVSITPVECSVICSRELAERFFRPMQEAFNDIVKSAGGQEHVIIGKEDYIVIQVEGEGLQAGQRVLELTSPLAMAGISIFFITTYFSDFILVPARSRRVVTTTLEQRGFVFSHQADAFVSQLSPSSPSTPHHKRTFSSSTSSAESGPPTTPPAQSVPELQVRTFARLKKHNIRPQVDSSLRLISCSGSKDPDPELVQRFQNDLTQVLIATTPAALVQSTTSMEFPTKEKPPDFSTRFLSLTITANDGASVLLEHSLADRLGSSLLGAKHEEDILIPITLDLRDLSMEATGVVCGVAGRLATETTTADDMSPGNKTPQSVDLSFLSTARAGTVIVKVDELDRAITALERADEEIAKSEAGVKNGEGGNDVGQPLVEVEAKINGLGISGA